MKGFEDLQQLWQGQAPEPKVSIDTITARIKQSNNALSRKLLWQCVALILTVAALLALLTVIPFSTWTSYLGLTLVVGSIFHYFTVQLLDLRRIRNNHSLLSKPQEYIRQLREFKARRNRFNTRSYLLYELVLAFALALYAVELYFGLPFWIFIPFPLAVTGWFLFCHFVLMKQYIRQENERIEEMIDNLGRISDQFSEE